MPNDSKRVQSVFLAAVEKSPTDRAALLAQECGTDTEFRMRVEALLKAHDQPGSFLDQPAGGPSPTLDQPGIEHPGQMIGPYKLREQLGTGGMGTVWAAEQKQPLHRKVALKVIKPGMDTSNVIARFEAEREALALMDHPNIAKVLDAGTTEQNRPYFVMELIRGVSITDYCDTNKLTVRERLELFVQVCKAVQHAHQKGIIHRDIKPSNVLVTEQDGNPVPKVIDFGIAKALHRQLTDHSIYTGVFQAIGTLAYMSPEQAALSSVDVDTRADIYGLGVLLYELLTGTTPFDRKQLEQAALDEACRMIREQDPPRPSTKLNTLGEKATAVSLGRGTDPRALQNTIRGDLDWIVMKALDKDRARRYETSSMFAADVQRFLQNEPIEARAPSYWYRTRKFVHRNRGAVTIAAVVLVLVAGGIAGTVSGWRDSLRTVAQLEKTHAELQQAVEDLRDQDEIRHSIMDWALLEALSGEFERAQKAANISRLAGADKSWTCRLQGLIALFGGDPDKAIEYLMAAMEADGTSVAARGMLSMAYLSSGDSDGWLKMNSELVNCSPRSAEDWLFKGYSRLNVEELTRAIELRSSPLAYAMRAQIVAVGSDPAKVADAFADIGRAEVAAHDASFVDQADLRVHLFAMNAAGRQGPDYPKLAEEAERLAAKLRGNRAASLLLAWYYDWMENPSEAEAAWQCFLEGGRGRGWRHHAAAFFYRRGDVTRALELVSGSQTTERCTRGWILAENPETRQEALKIYEEIVAENRRQPRFVAGGNPIRILLMLGERVRAQEQCRTWLETANIPAHQLDTTRFFANMISSSDLLSRVNPCPANFFIGMVQLAEGHREDAKVSFSKAVATGCVSNGSYHWAKAYTARLASDPHWPRSLQVRKEPEE